MSVHLIRVVTCQTYKRMEPGLAYPTSVVPESLATSFNLRLNVCDIDIYIFTHSSSAKSLLSLFPRYSRRPRISQQLLDTLTHRLV
jgi:uroporphyrinogen-III synthase